MFILIAILTKHITITAMLVIFIFAMAWITIVRLIAIAILILIIIIIITVVITNVNSSCQRLYAYTLLNIINIHVVIISRMDAIIVIHNTCAAERVTRSVFWERFPQVLFHAHRRKNEATTGRAIRQSSGTRAFAAIHTNPFGNLCRIIVVWIIHVGIVVAIIMNVGIRWCGGHDLYKPPTQ